MLVKIISFIVGTLSTVAVSSFFLYPHFYPIPHSTTPADKRAEVIRRYYDRLNGKRYEDAWAQIHPKRKKEIEDTIPTWQEFAKRYASTVEHENIKVDLETDSDSEAIYQVSFDVRDACLRSTFYQWREKFVEDLYDSNVTGTRNLLEAARDSGVERVVYTSTVGCIGVPENGIGNEENPIGIEDMKGAYKRSKFQAEQTALEFARGGLPIVIVNPTAPVGGHDVKPTPTGRIVLPVTGVDEVAIYPSVLSVAQILAQYQLRSSTPPPPNQPPVAAFTATTLRVGVVT
jgi:hypothetical protein